MRIFDGPEALEKAVGTQIGSSDWLLIEQDRIQNFADATGDYQWIHVDVERALSGRFGATIAHGYLSLSLLPALAAQIYRVCGFTMTMNYGLNKVRFPGPVFVESRVRSSLRLMSLQAVAQGYHLTLQHTLEREGHKKPAVVAEQIRLLVV
jgi:acyl dehydratase